MAPKRNPAKSDQSNVEGVAQALRPAESKAAATPGGRETVRSAGGGGKLGASDARRFRGLVAQVNYVAHGPTGPPVRRETRASRGEFPDCRRASLAEASGAVPTWSPEAAAAVQASGGDASSPHSRIPTTAGVGKPSVARVAAC